MAKCGASPTLKLNDGSDIPVLGIGTYPNEKPSEDELVSAIESAIDNGYRLFDTASTYGTEVGLGKAVKNKISQGVVSRSDLYITTKLWSNCHSPDLVVGALKKSLENLDMDYVDQYLIHTRVSLQATEELYPKDEEGRLKINDDIDIKDVWREMEKCKNLGLTKSIGVSNFRKRHLQDVLDNCTIKPVINQVECHPFRTQVSLVEYCRSHDVMVSCYSPLAQPGVTWRAADDPKVIGNTVLEAIGKKYKKTAAQVAIRFQVQRGLVVLPKSFNKDRQLQNMKVFDFSLSESDMSEIYGMHNGFCVSNAFAPKMFGHSKNYSYDKGD